MKKGKCKDRIGIWCDVSSDEYDLLKFTLGHLLEIPTIKKIVVVVTDSVIPKNFGQLSKKNKKVYEVCRDFGYGYDLSVEEGGYDQVSARNYALGLIESFDVDWLLLYDADDFYYEKIFDEIVNLGPEINGACCSCYTITSISGYWFEEKSIREYNGITLLNPHVRIWRSELGLRFMQCDEAEKRFLNSTRHCGIFIPENLQKSIKPLPEPYHFHLHCILGKRYSKRRLQGREFNFVLPDTLIKCISSINQNSCQINEGLHD